MSIATHLGPWLLGTVKETTGTTAGTVRNTGATTVGQSKAIASTDAAATLAYAIPAGSRITEILLYQSGATFTSGTSGTLTILLNGVSIAVTTITTGTAGVINIPCNASTTSAALWSNVGTTDALITYTCATLNAGSGLLSMDYIVRGADGVGFPASA